MSFILCSKVQIGAYLLQGGINEADIKRSVKEIIDTAKIKVPAIGRVNNNDNQPSTSIETSKIWQEGDKVSIQLGHNGSLKTEFMGFVRRVNASIPVEVDCEGYAWQLRRKYFNKSWKSVLLKELLKEITAGTDITLSPFLPDINFTNIKCPNKNGLAILEYLRDHCKLCVYFQFNVLYAGLEEAVPGSVVKYRLGWNTVRDDQLKYRVADETQVQVRLVTGKGLKNKRTLITKGDAGGSLVSTNIANLTDETALNAIADQQLAFAKYTGYEGAITGFLQPYSQPSDTAQIIDKQYDVRGGSFFIEAVEVKFGMQGAQRKVSISRAVSLTPALSNGQGV